MTIMGEPVTNFAPIEKIPGVKPPLGLETRPAAAPNISPLQHKILEALRSYAKADEDLGQEVAGRTIEVIARLLKESYEDVADAMGELFDKDMVVRPVRGLWLAKVVKDITPTCVPAVLETKPPIPETKPPIPETPAPVRETKVPVHGTLGWRRAKLRELAPKIGDRVVLVLAFPKTGDRVVIGQEVKRWPEFSYTVDKAEGVQGRGRAVVTRVHVDQTEEAKPKMETVAENASYRLEAPVEVETKSIPTPKQAPKLDELVRRARDECDAKIAAARAQMEQAQELALREFNSRVEGITWALEQIGGAA